MKRVVALALLVLWVFGFISSASAGTDVTSITASPDSLYFGENTTITVNATPGVNVLNVRVLTSDMSTVVHTGLPLAEVQPGVYTAQWNAATHQNVAVSGGVYALRTFDTATATYIGPSTNVTVIGSISVPPFIPTGTNAATITVQANPGQTGLTVGILNHASITGQNSWWYDANSNRFLPLTETSTPGIYTATWNGIYHVNNYIMPSGTCTVYFYDAAGNQSAITGQFTIQGVQSVSASPNQFNPLGNETTTITVNAAAELNLEAKVTKYNSSTGKYDLVRTLTLTGSGTAYTASWDGKDEGGNIVQVASYQVEVWHTGSPARYYPTSSVQVSAGASSITVSPNPFILTGTNAATITVQANPGQTGLTVGILNHASITGQNSWWYDANSNRFLPLTETSTPGIYTASWNGVYHVNNYIMPSGTCTVYFYDAAGNQSAITGQVIIQGVQSVSASPSQFNPIGNETTTITVNAAAGLNLEAKITRHNSSTGKYDPIRTLALTGSETAYTASWDGKDEGGNIVQVASYQVEVWHTGSPARYYPTSSVQVSAGASSITVSPNPFTLTGTNAATITVQANPGQTGLTVGILNHASITGQNSWWYDANSNRFLPLTETSTPGIYTATWNGIYHVNNYIMPSGTCTVYFYDAAGNQSAITGQVTIQGVQSVSASPSQFNPIGNETTTITVNAAAELNLEAKVTKYNSSTGKYDLVRTLTLTGSGTAYTASWDGKDEGGNIVQVASYQVEVWHTGSPARYYPTSSVQVSAGASSITVSPNPFTLTGTNAATITVQANPGQTGLTVGILNHASITGQNSWWYDANSNRFLPLTETSTPGIYTASWNGVYHVNNYIMPSGTCTVYFYDAAGNQSAITGQFTIQGVQSVSASPRPFTPGGNSTTIISAVGGADLALEARIYNDSTNMLTRSLNMTEASGNYSAEWNGKDAYDNFAGSGNYSIFIHNRDSGQRYYPSYTLQVNVAVFAISASPDPFVPTGANQTTVTVLADPGQSGIGITITHPETGTTPYLPLRESGSAGTYVTEWDGKVDSVIPKNGTCTIRVYDGSGIQFPATGVLTLSSAKSLLISPKPFDATGISTTTITAEMPAGLHLEARIGSVRTLPLTESADVYTVTWDGKGLSSGLVPAGIYTVAIWNTDTGTRYDLQDALQVNIIDIIPPETLRTSGPADGSYIGSDSATFAWSGTDNMQGTLSYSYILDGGAWSVYGASSSATLTGLPDGSHTIQIKTKDQAGNEDPTPVVIHFTVDTVPPSAPSGFAAISASTGVRFNWAHSSSPDIDSYRLYWDNGTGTINYSSPFATIYYPSSSFTASMSREGSYQFALRALDKAGNEEKNTSQVASYEIIGLTIGLSVDPVYDRGQDIPLAGTVTLSGGEAISNIPVTLDVECKGFHRSYTAYTDATGQFRYTFQPIAGEAGTYTVTARAMKDGIEKTISASFRILGLYLQPPTITVDMSMNSPKTVNINLRNIGSTAIADLQYTLDDSDLTDPVKGFIDTASLPTNLAEGASVVIPVLIITDPGTPPAVPAVFTLNVVSSDGASESAEITVRLHEAVSLPVMDPDPVMVGVRTGTPVTKTVTITNQGYADMQESALIVHDPALYSWVSIPDGIFGTFNPQEAKSCQIVVNPHEGTTLGSYVIQLDLNYSGTTKPVYITVEVTTATVGQISFKVHDDTGSVVSGAEVNLISKEFYVNITPNGRQEYNNVIKGTTNQQGYILFSDVPAGEYRYFVNMARHDQKDGLITVEPGPTPQTIGVIMVTNLVNVDFSVTQTTIQDQYTVNLNITYVTDLIKPTLFATPHRVDLSFFPEETFQGAMTIKNTSNNAPVRDLTLDASALNRTDNEIRVVFDDSTEAGTQKITLGALGPGESVQIPYKATIYASNPNLNNRNLGAIIATAEFDFSIDGKVEKSTTTTPIPVLYWKPQEFSLPNISYINDETDGNLCDLEYQGTTYRLSVKSNRNMGVTLDTLKAVNQENGGPDAASIVSSNSAMWTGNFTPTTLNAKGDSATFDIDDLRNRLETRLCNDRNSFLGRPDFVGFEGQWADRSDKDPYLIPISITTIGPQRIVISDTTPGGGWVGGIIPCFNEHGTVKLQIDQKASLEREAFNAKISIKPSVTPLDNFKATISIKAENGDDASGLFFVVVTQKTGIVSVDGSNVSGPADITWQLIPNSNAGGTTANGKNYFISATIGYNFSGGSYTFTTEAETITVKPMPKLTIDYKLPYITMAGKPVKIKAIVTNNGYGPAHNLIIKSAQPKILENLNDIPVSFTLIGSSATPNDNTLQNGVREISFGDIPAGGTAEGYWLLSTTKDGYFVEFTSTLTHQDYLGIQLDPLIEATNTHLIPAIGGEIFMPPNTTEGMKVELYQGGALKGQDTVNAYGNYLIPDLMAGGYEWALKDASGNGVDGSGRDITVVDGQPTARIDYGKPERDEYVFPVPEASDARNMVVITHGWAPLGTDNDTAVWMSDMAKMICTQLKAKLGESSLISENSYGCYFGDWQVISIFWTKSAMTPYPNEAFVNADSLGRQLGESISKYYNYNYIHLIGHSAGAKLIDSAKNAIKANSKTTRVLLTFLDAFDKNNNNSELGKNPNLGETPQTVYSEHYVDTRIIGSISTDFYLDYAFNFDISDLDLDARWWDNMNFVYLHGWPYRFYSESNNPCYQNSYPDCNKFGFVLSKEFLDPLNNDWSYSQKFNNGCCRPPTRAYDQCGIENSTCPTEGFILRPLHQLTMKVGDVFGDFEFGIRKTGESLGVCRTFRS